MSAEKSKPGYLIRATRPTVHLWFPMAHAKHEDALRSLCGKWYPGDDVDFNTGPSMKWCKQCAGYRGAALTVERK